MPRTLKDLLGDGYEHAGAFSREIRVTAARAAQLAAEDPDVAPYGRPLRKITTIRKVTTPVFPVEVLPTPDGNIPGDIRAVNESTDAFVKRAMTARNFFVETLAGAIVFGMGISPADCTIVSQPGHLTPIGQPRADLSWIRPRDGYDFAPAESRWRDAPGYETYGRVTSCNAALLTHEWRKLMDHPDRTAGQTDHQLLVLAFIRVLGCLPTRAELVTEMLDSGKRVRWRYRRREDAGSSR